jgi:hypothetical protein
MVALSVFWSLVSARRHRDPAPRAKARPRNQGSSITTSVVAHPGPDVPELRVRVVALQPKAPRDANPGRTVAAKGRTLPLRASPRAADLVHSSEAGGTGIARLLERIAAAGVGRPRLLTSAPGSHVLLFAPCHSCQGLVSPQPSGCLSERKAIESALAETGPSGRVVEQSCNPHGDGTCTFHIQSEVAS